MEAIPSGDQDFFPSTLEHRPLHLPEKVELKRYFAQTGAEEYEGFTPSAAAITPELADLEAWYWGLRFWGRECLVRGGVAIAHYLSDTWEAALERGEGDEVSRAALYGEILSPAEAASTALWWGNIPSEEKAIRIQSLPRPLPAAWLDEPLATALQAKPFYWGAFAAHALLEGILIKRDPTAAQLAQACCGAVRVRMLEGHAPAEAVAFVKDRVVGALRAWMGPKW